MFKFELNEKVKDKVTGYAGRITATCEYLGGSRQYYVESIDNTGRPICEWELEDRLERMED